MFQLTINGRRLSAEEGDTVLDVAQRADIHVPTLCHHEAVEPFGSCRLCMVEVTKPSWNGWKGLMTSCLYPAAPDLVIDTNSESVRHVRKNVLDLLLARCPESRLIQEMAEEYGISQTTFMPRADADLCILCGLCVRVCDTAVTSAIATVNRGYEREIGTPWGGPPEDCVGCGACAQVCPTGQIVMAEADGVRHIWQQNHQMVRCKSCNDTFMTEAERDHLMATRGMNRDYFEECAACKRERTAAKLAGVVLATHPDFEPKQLGSVAPPTLHAVRRANS
jgi:bidirectional [NiFe] hydrogenase diaphorase subunit